MRLLPLTILLSIWGLSGCESGTETPSTNSGERTEASNVHVPEVLEISDHRDTLAILPYLNGEHGDRPLKAAIHAVCSYPSFDGALLLTNSYDHADDETRALAYYATGQQQCEACLPQLMDQLAFEQNPNALVDLYEGIGKIARLIWDDKLDSLITANPDHRRGAAWHLYRCGLRGDLAPGDEERAIYLLNEDDIETRLGAAHFLWRTSDLDLTRFLSDLEAFILTESETDVKIALVGALRHVNGVLAAPILEETAQNLGLSPLVRVQALRAYRGVKRKNPLLVQALVLDPDYQVRATAATLLSEVELSRESLDAVYTQYRERHYADRGPIAELEGAWLIEHREQGAAKQLCEIADSTQNSYHRAAIIASLREAALVPGNLLEDWILQDSAAIVRTTATEVLVHLMEQGRPHMQPKALLNFAQEVFAKGDQTSMGLLAAHFANPEMNYAQYNPDWQFIREARQKLELPRDFETAVALDQALAALEGREYKQPKPEYNHPPNTQNMLKYGDHPKAKVTSSRGTYTLQLDAVGAPTVVQNFVELANSGYFNGKAYHRVVPNFVIQTGCPRGDGWGSTNYTIRSDFGPHRYRAGSVGMASLGADTESCQWFVTHSATPHLEGRYSVFGQVIEGMEVVQQIGVGDRIETVEILTDEL